MKRHTHDKNQGKALFIIGLLSAVFLSAAFVLRFEKQLKEGFDVQSTFSKETSRNSKDEVKTARVMANGDLLYHDLIYMSALTENGDYDFYENFQYVRPWLQQADLAIGDFEGTIHPDLPLAGYPLFNAPASVSFAIKDAGYDVVDLAHNHILDSGLSGLFSTVAAFKNADIETVGVYTDPNRAHAPLFIKEVNGIKIAILAYAYGFNGLEEQLSLEEQEAHLSTFDEEKMKAEIERAENEADVTIVMPQAGVEYDLQPTQEERDLYHRMIEWGADVILGGHPHVVQPAEIVTKDQQKKLILYSMGNFLSNQRLETMEDVETAVWTERGVLMDLTFEKSGKGTRIKMAEAHPTWVNRVTKGSYSPEGHELYHYQTYVLADFIEGGKYRTTLDDVTKERIDTAYREMKEHVQLNWQEAGDTP